MPSDRAKRGLKARRFILTCSSLLLQQVWRYAHPTTHGPKCAEFSACPGLHLVRSPARVLVFMRNAISYKKFFFYFLFWYEERARSVFDLHGTLLDLAACGRSRQYTFVTLALGLLLLRMDLEPGTVGP